MRLLPHVISWQVVACLMCFLGVLLALFAANYSKALELGGMALAGAGVLVFIAWVAHDAKKCAARLEKEAEPAQPESPQRETEAK